MKILPLLVIPVVGLLNSCSLVSEAAKITANEAREVAPGTTVAGDGFIVKAPEEHLYAQRDDIRKGDVTFRPVDTFREGLVYSVSPFSSATATTTDQALDEWNRLTIPKNRQVIVSEKSSASFAGLRGTQVMMEIPMSERGGLVAARLVVKRSKDFLIVTRGDAYFTRDQTARMKGHCKTGLRKLMQNTTLTGPR
jgi:hypothetical protein